MLPFTIGLIAVELAASVTLTAAQQQEGNEYPSSYPRPPAPPPGLQVVPQGAAPPVGIPAPVDVSIPERFRRLPGETEQQYQARVSVGSTVINLARESRGKPITIAGRTVQLPPDAYLYGIVAGVMCVEGAGQCPEAPAYVIKRGNSVINVVPRNGKIQGEYVAPGEEGAFDFLRESLE